jgi:hypothetical protein
LLKSSDYVRCVSYLTLFVSVLFALSVSMIVNAYTISLYLSLKKSVILEAFFSYCQETTFSSASEAYLFSLEIYHCDNKAVQFFSAN